MPNLLSDLAVVQLREIARRVLREEIPRIRGELRPNETGATIYICKTDGSGITARSSDTPGSGSCTIYYRSTGNALTSASTETVTIYNMVEAAVGANRYVQAKQDVFGSLWVDVEACT